MDNTDTKEEKTEEKKEENKEKKEADGLKTKPLPIIIVLTAAGLSCVISIIQGKDFSTFFFRLLVSVLVFAFLGSLVKMTLDMIFNRKPPEEEEKEDEQGSESGEEESPLEVENIDTEDVDLRDIEEQEPTEGQILDEN